MVNLAIIASEEVNIKTPEIEILTTTPVHLRMLAEVLRPEDRQEILAFGASPEKGLWRSYRSSVLRKTAFVDGQIAAIWGLRGKFMGSTGQPWLLTSHAVHKISPLKFTRIYQQEVKQMLDLFPKLMNVVDASYISAIRLLDIVGFKIHEPEPWGTKGELYRKFEIEV